MGSQVTTKQSKLIPDPNELQHGTEVTDVHDTCRLRSAKLISRTNPYPQAKRPHIRTMLRPSRFFNNF
jgi:hypothetical protein